MAKNLLLFSVSVFVLLSPQKQVNAQESDSLDISANIGFVSEYSFRGIAQSDEKPAIQGGFDVSHDSGLYAGIWGSNVDFNDGDEATIETDLYAGYKGTCEGISYDIGGIYYAYPGADSALNYDYFEAALSLGYDFGVASTSASLNYSPEYFADSGDALYYKAGIDVPLPHEIGLSAHIGHQDIDDNTAFGVPDYTDWSVGLGYTLKGFDLSVQYIDTDLDEPTECADGCAERIIVGVSKSF